MKQEYKFVFDMDGTLYQFDKGLSQSFFTSQFYTNIRENAYIFLMEKCQFSRSEVIIEYDKIYKKYDGEMSIGIEKELKIDRYEYFERTWNLSPAKYIESNSTLSKTLDELQGRVAVLTAAPKIWTKNVLEYLELKNIFGKNVYTGDADLRKPSPLIFQKIANDLSTSPQNMISIGDQEFSDIVPAKSIGMKTVLIGSSENTVADYQSRDVISAINLLRKEGFV